MQLGSPIVTNATGVVNGASTLQLSIPNDPSFASVVMFAQAAPAITGGNLAFHVTNGICVAIGLF